MKIAIMQPYFFPYIGYFKLINAADIFVIYDNIEYSKKGWINRNRLVFNNKVSTFSLPLVKSSNSQMIINKMISNDTSAKKLLNKTLNLIDINYKNSKNYKEIFPIINNIFADTNQNLFNFLFKSICEICRILNINTEIIKSSKINIDDNLRHEKRVIATCKKLKALYYINSIGGTSLYSSNTFLDNGIKLRFIKTGQFTYYQNDNFFFENLSIIDTLMHVSIEDLSDELSNYNLISTH